MAEPKETVHGGDIYRNPSVTDYSVNSNPLGVPEAVRKSVQESADRIMHYPDVRCDRLREAISGYEGIEKEGSLSRDEKLTADCRLLDIPLTATSQDTTAAAAEMERLGVGCVVVLGGDGTSRAVAKGIKEVPLLPLSTGTNNVYPEMLEGTVAGMAAAVAAQFSDPAICCIRDKQIEVTLNGSLTDIALIDAVISDDLCVGSKAIWDASKLQHIFVTRCHPASIGFSTAAGCLQIVRDTDDYGLAVELRSDGEKIIAPIAAGVLSELDIWQAKRMPLDCPETLLLQEECMVALDGERELRGHAGDTLTFTVTRHGPWRVQAKRALEEAVRREFFAAGRMIDPT